MRRHLAAFALALGCIGCVELDVHLRDTSARPVTPVAAIAVPITPDGVTAANARQMAQQLSVELDQEDLTPPPAAGKRN